MVRESFKNPDRTKKRDIIVVITEREIIQLKGKINFLKEKRFLRNSLKINTIQ